MPGSCLPPSTECTGLFHLSSFLLATLWRLDCFWIVGKWERMPYYRIETLNSGYTLGSAKTLLENIPMQTPHPNQLIGRLWWFLNIDCFLEASRVISMEKNEGCEPLLSKSPPRKVRSSSPGVVGRRRYYLDCVLKGSKRWKCGCNDEKEFLRTVAALSALS